MKNVFVVSSPIEVRSSKVIYREEASITRAGGKVVASVQHGTMVSGSRAVAETLKKEGFQVTFYPDIDRLRIAGLDIDISNPKAGLDPKEFVPADAEKSWPLYVVQFAGPPFPEWVAEVEKLGAKRVERANRYGLYVYADASLAKEIAQLRFVVFVSLLHPGWKLDPRLRKLPSGKTEQIEIVVFPANQVNAVSQTVTAMGGRIVHKEIPKAGRGDKAHIVVEVDPASALELAHLPNVRAVSWLPRPSFGGGRSVQIVAGNLNEDFPPNTRPVTGYPSFLANTIGVDGTGVTVAIVDSGVDVGAYNNVSGHRDLRGRQVAFKSYGPTGGVPTDQNGHGTHVAGIAVGNAATRLADRADGTGFLFGQGVAPGATFVTQSVANEEDPEDDFDFPVLLVTLTTDSVSNGALVQNNSWYAHNENPQSYAPREYRFDILVRDANNNGPLALPLTVVFCAGNDGGLPGTIGEPSGAKNVITVGNSLNYRPSRGLASDDIRGLNGSSSRGPAYGDRIKPDVVAPGTDVSSAFSSACTNLERNAINPLDNPDSQYLFLSGTSMSAPHVTGVCALLIEWWRGRTNGADPSPAMLKALLINGAVDLAGGPNWRAIHFNRIAEAPDRYQTERLTFVPSEAMFKARMFTKVMTFAELADDTWFYDPVTQEVTVQAAFPHASNPEHVSIHLLQDVRIAHLPNNDQGWGRVNLSNIVCQASEGGDCQSDRGHRLFIDQRHAFTNSGQHHTWQISPADPSEPMRATLVWTDAQCGMNDDTPLVNRLSLELIDAANAEWFGNPDSFANGYSQPGIEQDHQNNVECVYIEHPAGIYDLIVRGETVTQDAQICDADQVPGVAWQDYALVLENAVFANAAPVSVGVAVDCSGSMVNSGYVDVTRSTSKQFVELMETADRVGVVSFADNATPVFAGDDGKVALIDENNVTESACDAIDDIDFGGCTYMGDGLEKAREQLDDAPGNRAIVLMSDGYDNKGCQRDNPDRSSALEVANHLPEDIDVYTCAMGPASDQVTLEQIAAVTDGQYYYAPTIDDLYEIYNYIRGNVSGDGVIANTTGTASSSSIAAYVDCAAEQVVFACHWHAKGLRWVGHTPKKSSEIHVYLKRPDGKVVPANASWVHRCTGESYVIFTINEPQPGRWRVVVETGGEGHTQYTVGGWVRSDLQLLVELGRPKLGGHPLLAQVGLQLPTGRELDVRYTAHVSRPAMSLTDLIKQHKELFEKVQPDSKALADGMDETMARLLAVDQDLQASGQPSIFAQVNEWPKVTPHTAGKAVFQPIAPRLKRMVPFVPKTPEAVATPIVQGIPLATHNADHPHLAVGSAAFQPLFQRAMTHQLSIATKIAGSYTLRVRASGVDPQSRCYFERHAARCFVVR